ncbi:Chaperone protein dnaJ 49 [Apostasia shenzhenica]|uniref:Chaperone protein dnaJ 49 n=1 Tax=Apostasia shenzhenica TaxID=1088818 RepID=A0A2H9ZQW6_9ASPA|nr:Chaperone protein dnaJ 49 [Apostasia shenzhenica]
MDSNQKEAKKALRSADAKFKKGDIQGAVLMTLKAKRFFPNLHGLEGYLTAYLIHQDWRGRFTDWYALLGVSRSVSLDAIRKRFKELRSLTHPDKNASSAAEGAFKLVYSAWEAIQKEVPVTGGKSSNDEDDEEESEAHSAAQEFAQCPECSRLCIFLDSRRTIVECKRCETVAIRGGKDAEFGLQVIREGIGNFDIKVKAGVSINVHGGNIEVNEMGAVYVYGGGSILLNRCKRVDLKGGESIHISNSSNINFSGSGSVSFG